MEKKEIEKKVSHIVLILATVLMQIPSAHAEGPKPDKKIDTYTLRQDNKIVGKVAVKAIYRGEPILSPLKISVETTCVKGFQKKNNDVDIHWKTLRYGSASKPEVLSTFDSASAQLKIYFTDGKLDDEESVVAGEDQVKEISLKDVCLPSKK